MRARTMQQALDEIDDLRAAVLGGDMYMAKHAMENLSTSIAILLLADASMANAATLTCEAGRANP